MRDALIRIALVLVASVLPLTGCKEQFESRYPDVGTAIKAGAFSHGWLPAVLQPDATEIREWHDLDSDEVRGRFTLSNSLLERLQSACKMSQAQLPVGTGPSWWLHANLDGKTTAGFDIVRCDSFFIWADRDNGVGYFWNDR